MSGFVNYDNPGGHYLECSHKGCGEPAKYLGRIDDGKIWYLCPHHAATYLAVIKIRNVEDRVTAWRELEESETKTQ